MHRFAWLLLTVLLSLVLAAARAQPAETGLTELASPSFDSIRHGVELLAFSGHPRAAAIIAALQAGQLYARTADHTLFIKTADGAFIDAASGQAAPDVMASGLKQVRMNNPVRGAV